MPILMKVKKEVADVDAFDEGFGDEVGNTTEESNERPFLTDKENAQFVSAVLAIVAKV